MVNNIGCSASGTVFLMNRAVTSFTNEVETLNTNNFIRCIDKSIGTYDTVNLGHGLSVIKIKNDGFFWCKFWFLF